MTSIGRICVLLLAATLAGASPNARADHAVRHHGDSPSLAPATRIAPTPSGSGYYTMDAAGGVFTHGDAAFHGSIPGLRAHGLPVGPAGVTALSATPSGSGYWVLDDRGGVFSFGDAAFFGSVPGLPVTDLAPTPTGGGYSVLDEQGGVFAFGDAPFFGSLPGLRAQGHAIGPARVIGLTRASSGAGYWMLDERGGVFAFGGAPYHGSLPERGVTAEAVAMDAMPDGRGYWIATADGGVHAFGDAPFYGSAAGNAGGVLVVDFATSPHGTGYWLLLENGLVVTRDAAPPFALSVQPVSVSELWASWRPGCPVPPDRLRMVTASHWGFDGSVHEGRVVVHADHVATIQAVLRDLYDVRFPIERMEPIEALGGSDDASMDANNTSAFNCRRVTGGSSWSEHAYGRAIDINPIQNPYVNGSTVAPDAGRAHLDRNTPAVGKIRTGDAVVQAFTARGWPWGGHWRSPKDYQHFSATGS